MRFSFPVSDLRQRKIVIHTVFAIANQHTFLVVTVISNLNSQTFSDTEAKAIDKQQQYAITQFANGSDDLTHFFAE